ncbi:unnamed protein product [Lepeophtheirus salmonis]|uniref:(salmon louse) hypothetical protein n=1 Tax=Lepeophtheirus salmonis TaxID=72036 RepID=A0A7R8H3M1_LEPSM|nr:unnamed protein product [Lepeophtheirus salmonis]CAF2847967.1 unnamed protein product [Lepeophtheirus salmonis]
MDIIISMSDLSRLQDIHDKTAVLVDVYYVIKSVVVDEFAIPWPGCRFELLIQLRETKNKKKWKMQWTREEVERKVPEVLRGLCPKPCKPCDQKQIKKIVQVMQEKYPREWNEIITTYNG